jgi:signal transduction histidine kinase
MSEKLKPEATVHHLQAIVERDKAALARELHDEMGGYLIASAMDVTSLRHRFGGYDPDTRGKFDRLSKSLNDAIDMMRRLTEELHPTLLDNVGLFAAIRWQIKRICHRSKIVCAIQLPDAEPLLSRAAAINLFRVGQEALVIAETYPEVQKVEFTIWLERKLLVMRVVADGRKKTFRESSDGDRALGFLRHRIKAVGDELTLTYPDDGGLILDARISLSEAPELVEGQI